MGKNGRFTIYYVKHHWTAWSGQLTPCHLVIVLLQVAVVNEEVVVVVVLKEGCRMVTGYWP